eukprot:CAMPEP_0170109206 /NCGR_PEP_ID=MMETSP0020_2-20130122/7050_1 /TAXON_ID=98059 /ORGANISM="Dinobryon sp., Strain UTEXLB2267" /LENGTH=70 /DNA_ID=CAMNT_0010334117 /DNA_START=686 /DNA_END=898 /DNA_ORIENTATION=+
MKGFYLVTLMEIEKNYKKVTVMEYLWPKVKDYSWMRLSEVWKVFLIWLGSKLLKEMMVPLLEVMLMDVML